MNKEIERLVVQMAKENPGWGYDRIVGAMANLGQRLSDQTVGNILRRHGLSPAPKRKQAISWKDFICSHMEVLVGTDFFTVEVLTLKGLVTYYVLFFIHLESRRVSLAGMTRYPGQEWMEQQARNATMEEWGFLRGCRYLLHDRDTKFCGTFRELMESGSIKTIRLPARSPNLNSFAERWVRSVKEECLSRLILFGESSLRRALQQYIVHYHEERNHQGKENLILFPLKREGARNRKAAVRCRALCANIPETPVVLLINEQGEKEKGSDDRKFSWCCSFFWGFGWRGTERRRAKRAAAQWSGSQSGCRLSAGFGF